MFGVFLVLGPFVAIRVSASEFQALVWDGCLSLLFFLQHSGMIRPSVRARLLSRIPQPYHPAVYAIASGTVLTAVVLLWQASSTTIFSLHGPPRLLFRVIPVLVVVGFIWGVRALRVFDPFGRRSIDDRLRGRPLPAPHLTLRGPYLWVRHPLYGCVLVLIWSAPDVTLDRLCFNVLWSVWIVLGSLWEENDLAAAFGEPYRHYQETVPMLIPRRGRAGRHLQGS